METAVKSCNPITQKDVEFYKENGYLVVENVLNREEIDELKRETVRICRGEAGDVRGLEPGPAGEADDAVMRRYLCIHFPHKISEVMLNYVRHPRTSEVFTKLIGPNVKCMQSMLFIKASGKPGQAWHQDEYYIPTRDMSLTADWIAIDDATTENGCLWAIPGSHKHKLLWPQRVHNDPRFDCAGESMEFPYKDEDAIPLEMKSGSVVFFSGYLLHRSLPNRAKSGYRRALTNHYMSAESLLPWWFPKKGAAMGTHDHRDIVMIAGKDPYAWKGIENLAEPHVRPSGEGGCGNAEEHNKKQDDKKAEGGYAYGA